MSSEALRLARQVRTARNLDDALAHADRVLERARSRSQRLKGRGARAPGRMKPTKAEKHEARRSTRPVVEARENGRCAVHAIGGCRGNLVWDHFFGRGKEPPDPEKEWMLCEEHNRQKTDNVPNRIRWLKLFRLHAASHCYMTVATRCDVLIGMETAQHPEVSRG